MPTRTRNPTPRSRTGTPRGGDGLVDAREQQGPPDRQNRGARDETDDRGKARLIGAEPEDRAEEHVDGRGAVLRTSRAREQAREQHTEAEHPGEDGADHHVVRATSRAEHTHSEGDRGRHDEQPQPEVGAESKGTERARERRVAERVAAEDLASQHDEVADETGSGCNCGTGDEGVPHERVREDLREPGARRQHERDRVHGATPTSRRATRAVTYPAKAIVVIQNPSGYSE